jgi:CRISPR-associated protein Cmr6
MFGGTSKVSGLGRPIFFLTVTETPYRFAIAARSEQGNRLLDLAEKWLKGALTELGIGAKTSADYGFWDVS